LNRSTLRSHAKTTVATGGVVAASLIGIGGTFSSTAPSNVQTIYVRNVSTYVSDREVKRDLPAFQEALSADFAPSWHIDARLVFIGVRKSPVGAESITLVDKGPVKGALAYHEMVNGVADAVVYTGVSKFYGYAWSVGFTHELWEMLVDQPAGAGAVASMQDTMGTIWANEVADPVESDADGFLVNGVLISDFVTGKWFGADQAGPFDFAGHVQKPLVVDKGGYAQWWDGVNWNVVENFEKGGLGDGRGFYG
jgi:hypothetical protein